MITVALTLFGLAMMALSVPAARTVPRSVVRTR